MKKRTWLVWLVVAILCVAAGEIMANAKLMGFA